MKIFIIAVSLALLLGVSVAFLTGYLTLVVGKSNQTAVNHVSVCTKDIINQYNTANSGTLKSKNDYVQSIKTVAQKVESLSGYDKDPSCLFIVYKYYVLVTDIVKMRQLVDKLSALNQQGIYVSGDIVDLSGIKNLEDYVGTLERQKGKDLGSQDGG